MGGAHSSKCCDTQNIDQTCDEWQQTVCHFSHCQDVLDFWFKYDGATQWQRRNEMFIEEVRERFTEMHADAHNH